MTNESGRRSKPIYEVICGSQLYGLETPESDVDIGQIFADTKENLFGHGMGRQRISQVVTDSKDINGYWLREYANLCVKGNPNAIEWLWSHEGAIRSVHPLFKKHILDNSRAFLGMTPLRHSHHGFAMSQFKKMKVVSGKVGEKRRRYVKKYGYDIKYASHAIRLMYQLIELADTGRVVYPIRDGTPKQTVLAIKQGQMSETSVTALFKELSERATKAADRNIAGISQLANKSKVDQMLIDFFEEFYYARKEQLT